MSDPKTISNHFVLLGREMWENGFVMAMLCVREAALEHDGPGNMSTITKAILAHMERELEKHKEGTKNAV